MPCRKGCSSSDPCLSVDCANAHHWFGREIDRVHAIGAFILAGARRPGGRRH